MGIFLIGKVIAQRGRESRYGHSFQNFAASQESKPASLCDSAKTETAGGFDAEMDMMVREKAPSCVPKKLNNSQDGDLPTQTELYLLIMMLNLLIFSISSFGASPFSLPR